MLSGEGGAASSTRFKSKRRSEGPDIFKGVEERRGRTNQDLRSANEASTGGDSSVLWNLMPAPIKICTRRSFRNRRGACSEIEEAFAFSKVGLLKDLEG
ncbi:hypothetical protein ACFX2B_022900 [Malus domestica]